MRERTRAAVGAACAVAALGAALGGCNRPMTPREEAYGRRPAIRGDGGYADSAAGRLERHRSQEDSARSFEEMRFLREMGRGGRR